MNYLIRGLLYKIFKTEGRLYECQTNFNQLIRLDSLNLLKSSIKQISLHEIFLILLTGNK